MTTVPRTTRRRPLFAAALVAVAAAACGDASPATPMPDMASNLPLRDLGPEGADLGAPKPATAVVLGADFTSSSGSIVTVSLPDGTASKPRDTTLSSDTDVRCALGTCYVLNRTKSGDRVRVYDPATWKVSAEITVGDGTVSAVGANPHDAYPSTPGGKLYVTAFGNKAANALAVLDVARPDKGVVKWIALPVAAADKDGKPEADRIHKCGDLLYVTLQDLDENDPSFTPTGPGRIAVVDPATDTLVGTPIQLQGADPTSLAVEGAGCDRLLVADADQQFGKLSGGGGVERVDLSQRKSLGFVAKDTDLKGHPSSVSVVSPTLAYLVLQANFASQVVAFDPSKGTLLGPVQAAAGYVAFAAVTPDRKQVLVGVASGDTSKGQPAVGVYLAPADGKQLPATPISIGQPPNAVAFY